MEDSGQSKRDDSVLNLAREIAHTRERRMPAVLLKLRDVLEKAPPGTPEGKLLRNEAWEYNLVHMLIIIIHQDFSILPGEWRTAAALARTLRHAVCGLDLVGKDRQELQAEQLPKAMVHMLLLAKHIQQQLVDICNQQDTAKQQGDLILHMKDTLEALVDIVRTYFFLCPEVMQSPWLLQLLVCDEPRSVNLVMNAMEKVLKIDRQVLSKIKEACLQDLVDELIYKLSVNKDISIAAGATRCLLQFCDHHKPLVETLFSRYKGLRPLLRRWEGWGFERDLKQLFTLLDTGSALKAQTQMKNDAATYIQAKWKGYITRQKLKKANQAFAKFQRSYRIRKAVEEHEMITTKVQTELQRRMLSQRQNLMRQFKEKQLHALEILPADQIEKYLMKEKSKAALKIQTLWRGHRERSQLLIRQQVAQQVHAAIKIQRAVRRWLEKLEQQQKRQGVPVHFKPAGLTEERRVYLQELITRRQQEMPTARKTREELEEMHKRSSEMLGQHYSRVGYFRKKQYNWENLLARLDTDSELLLLAPPLKDVTQKDVEMFSSRSLPVATKAKAQHNVSLQRLQRPWWRQLWDEEEEMDDALQEQLEAEMNFFF
ncbi:IQ calmodulin-binding motif-containing protein 1-like [Pomacea canaliculata]|uniref:IQ calmodulin-binding motif-containing protein 1-like n=1 Tax=Pomacea canaliculata TaxID=400727 RepID=UPI000D73DF29|nr:IQ calmodulin-binding motif-containing protein 1-like [Pomacea canaliculata]